jgi:polysaccharide biosynthesis protein PslA
MSARALSSVQSKNSTRFDDSHTRFSFAIIVGFIKALDLVIFCSGGAVGYAADLWAFPTAFRFPSTDFYVLGAATATLAASMVLSRSGVYAPNRLCRSQLSGIPAALSVGCAFLLSYCLLFRFAVPLALLSAFSWGIVGAAGAGLARAAVAVRLRALASGGKLGRRIVVVGANRLGFQFIERMRTADDEPVEVVALFDEPDAVDQCGNTGIPFRGMDELVEFSRATRIDEIVIALPPSERGRIESILELARTTVADVHLVTDELCMQYAGCKLRRFAGAPVITVSERPIKDWRAFQKSVFDRTLAAFALIALGPVLCAIAALVKLETPGPAFFLQRRVGFNNRSFTVFKFRTMHHAAEDRDGDVLTKRNDPRVTRVGRILRKYSLDELPQLANVVIGNMSLVGPRPHALHAKAADAPYDQVVRHYARRHRVKPGITGWAQVNGWRGETQTREQIEMRIAHDLEYIDNWSLWLDVKIILLTILRETRSRHAF